MKETGKALKPINFKTIIRNQKNKKVNKLPNFVIAIMRKILKEKQLNKFIEANGNKYNYNFIEEAIKYFNVKTKVYGLEKLDPSKSYIFVSNHPIGGWDFAVVMSALRQKFSNIKVIANKVLESLDNIKELIIPVGVFDKTEEKAKEAIKTNMNDKDNQILTFPAGLVSRMQKNKIVDMPWHRSFVRNAIEYKREIVPIYVDSFNSKFFYNIGRLRKFLGIKANIEMFFIISEQFKKANKTIPIYIGNPIHYSSLTENKTHLEWAREIQNLTSNLKASF